MRRNNVAYLFLNVNREYDGVVSSLGGGYFLLIRRLFPYIIYVIINFIYNGSLLFL